MTIQDLIGSFGPFLYLMALHQKDIVLYNMRNIIGYSAQDERNSAAEE
jgi:hypothetical protein